MMKDSDLTRIVELAIEDALAAKRVVAKSWLTQAIVTQEIADTDSDFATACAYHAIADVVRHVIQRAKYQTEIAEPQLVLPGYERLQSRYAVIRKNDDTDENEVCLVPTDLLTVKELRAKARELRSFAQGALEHAREIDALADAREAAA